MNELKDPLNFRQCLWACFIMQWGQGTKSVFIDLDGNTPIIFADYIIRNTLIRLIKLL
jgi:hypothetical protein